MRASPEASLVRGATWGGHPHWCSASWMRRSIRSMGNSGDRDHSPRKAGDVQLGAASFSRRRAHSQAQGACRDVPRHGSLRVCACSGVPASRLPPWAREEAREEQGRPGCVPAREGVGRAPSPSEVRESWNAVRQRVGGGTRDAPGPGNGRPSASPQPGWAREAALGSTSDRSRSDTSRGRGGASRRQGVERAWAKKSSLGETASTRGATDKRGRSDRSGAESSSRWSSNASSSNSRHGSSSASGGGSGQGARVQELPPWLPPRSKRRPPSRSPGAETPFFGPHTDPFEGAQPLSERRRASLDRDSSTSATLDLAKHPQPLWQGDGEAAVGSRGDVDGTTSARDEEREMQEAECQEYGEEEGEEPLPQHWPASARPGPSRIVSGSARPSAAAIWNPSAVQKKAAPGHMVEDRGMSLGDLCLVLSSSEASARAAVLVALEGEVRRHGADATVQALVQQGHPDAAFAVLRFAKEWMGYQPPGPRYAALAQSFAAALDLGQMLEVRDMALAAACVPPPAAYEAMVGAFLERSRRRCGAARRVALVSGAWQLYRQMRDFIPGSTLSADAMSTLFEMLVATSSARDAERAQVVLRDMRVLGMRAPMPVYRRLITQALEVSRADTACQLAREMVQAGMPPPISALEAIVFAAARTPADATHPLLPRAAAASASPASEAEPVAAGPLPIATMKADAAAWAVSELRAMGFCPHWKVLSAAMQAQNAAGNFTASLALWEDLQHTHGVALQQGPAAPRHGIFSPSIYSPYLVALCGAGRYSEAVSALQGMLEAGSLPSDASLLQVLAVHPRGLEGVQAVCQEMERLGHPVRPAARHARVMALLALGDTSAAKAAMQRHLRASEPGEPTVSQGPSPEAARVGAAALDETAHAEATAEEDRRTGPADKPGLESGDPVGPADVALLVVDWSRMGEGEVVAHLCARLEAEGDATGAACFRAAAERARRSDVKVKGGMDTQVAAREGGQGYMGTSRRGPAPSGGQGPGPAGGESGERKLTREQRQALAGLMLAGARMLSRDMGRTFALRLEASQIFGSNERAALMQHLEFLFKPWWASGASDILSGTGGEGGEGEEGEREWGVLETVSDMAFRFYAKQYCPGGTPRVPRLVHRWLTPCALAHWYAYGGRRCATTGGIIFRGNRFSVPEVRALAVAAGAQEAECARKVLESGEVEVRFEGGSALRVWGKMESHVPQALRDALRPMLVATGGAAGGAAGVATGDAVGDLE